MLYSNRQSGTAQRYYVTQPNYFMRLLILYVYQVYGHICLRYYVQCKQVYVTRCSNISYGGQLSIYRVHKNFVSRIEAHAVKFV